MNYIDAHVHVWTHPGFRYPDALPPFPPGAPENRPSSMIIPHYGPEDILRQAHPSGVQRVVLIQMINYGTDNRYMLDVIAKQPDTFRGVAIIDHRVPDPAGEMRRLKKLGVRGFRIYGVAWLPFDPPKWLDHPGFAAMFRCAGEEDMAICTLVDPSALPALARMCDRFPDAPVVIDHFARIGVDGPPSSTEIDLLCTLAKHRNVYVKVSAFYALGIKKAPHDDLASMLRRVFDAFGPRRMLWASDCPFQTLIESYEDGITLVRDRTKFLTAEDKRWILGATAEKLFFA